VKHSSKTLGSVRRYRTSVKVRRIENKDTKRPKAAKTTGKNKNSRAKEKKKKSA
jgi:hypothetical protein